MAFKHTYFYAIFWQRIKRNRLAMSGAFVVAALLTAIATREPALAGTPTPQRPAAVRTSSAP